MIKLVEKLKMKKETLKDISMVTLLVLALIGSIAFQGHMIKSDPSVRAYYLAGK